MTVTEVDQAALARGALRLDGDGEPTVRIGVPTGPATHSAEERERERALHEASGHVLHRSWCQWRIAARAADKPHLSEQVFPIPSLNTVDVGSGSLSATLSLTKADSGYRVETIMGFVEALGHNVIMLHSDREPVLVQVLRAVQSRRVKRTLVRHGPRASHQESG